MSVLQAWPTGGSLRVVLTVAVLIAFVIGSPVPVPATHGVIFDEVTGAYGVDTELRVEKWGVSTVDWDNDNRDDLYVGRHADSYKNGFPAIYRNAAGPTFIDTQFDPACTNCKDRHALAFGDYNGDERPDLFIPAGGHEAGGEDQLYQWQVDRFVNVTPDDMKDRDGRGRFVMWLDYDGDGDLDLFHGRIPPQDFSAPDCGDPVRGNLGRSNMWQNNGPPNWTFTRLELFTAGCPERASAGVAANLNKDGWLDIILVPGKEGAGFQEKLSVYYSLRNGTFKRVALGIPDVDAAVPGDYDNDGDTDLFLARPQATVPQRSAILYRNDGVNADEEVIWFDDSAKLGQQIFFSQSAAWADVDNDGDLDLFIARTVDAVGVNQSNMLLINTGAAFNDESASSGLQGPIGPNRGDNDQGAWADFDRDGRVDFAVLINQSTLSEPVPSVFVYANHSTTGGNWLTVRLRDLKSGSYNRRGIGAKVFVTVGTQTQYREINSATAFRSQGPQYVHFGLGSATIIDRLEVVWPDGARTVRRNLDVNKHKRVKRTDTGTIVEDLP